MYYFPLSKPPLPDIALNLLFGTVFRFMLLSITASLLEVLNSVLVLELYESSCTLVHIYTHSWLIAI